MATAGKVPVAGPIIVGAGPSGLAVAASLRQLSIPSTVLEKSNGIAHLWRCQAYDRLRLHLPKHFCQLPHLPFPPHFPTYPSKAQFLSYLCSYADRFSIDPVLRTAVVSVLYNHATQLWHVTAETAGSDGRMVTEYTSAWLVVATGENAEAVVPCLQWMERFRGSVVHTSEYKNGEAYRGKRVLVVGCGNSGMEVSLDLWEHGALPFVSIRSGVHVLPREILGISTFGLAMKLLRWLTVGTVDKIILALAKMVLGDTEKYGIKRPRTGPLQLKFTSGKSPVLEQGTLALIKKGSIKIVPEVESLTSNGARFVDETEMRFDSVIFATGYKNNIPSWLKGSDFKREDDKLGKLSPEGWRGKNGCYFVGFTGRGLLGVASDAQNVALDIATEWNKLDSMKCRENK